MATPINVNQGGDTTFLLAAGGSGPTVIFAGRCRLAVVLITALGTAGLNFYDNASAASGTIVGAIPASAAVGSLYIFPFLCVNGLTAGTGNNTPACTVGYWAGV